MAAKRKTIGRAGRRTLFQWVSTVLANSYVLSPAGKFLCVPILNCYSCPIGTTACPIGSLSAFAMLRRVPYYILGLLGLIAITCGRMFCGWACPFGMLQDLMYRIPSPKWSMPKGGNALKYVLLFVLVLASPFFLRGGMDKSAEERITGAAKTYDYCSLVCPAGTLEAGIPYRIIKAFSPRSKASEEAADPDPSAAIAASLLDEGAGPPEGAAASTSGSWRFGTKLGILIVVLFLMVPMRRSFCRGLCPLGALMAIFSRASLLRLRTDRGRCTRCRRCVTVCSTSCRHVPEKERQRETTAECVLCLDCVRNCPVSGALSVTFAGKRLTTSRGKTDE